MPRQKKSNDRALSPARTQGGTDLQAPVRQSIEDVAADVATNAAAFADHSARHENGGADELNVAGLNGVLADPQTPAAHKVSHQNGGADEIDVTGLSGLLADPQTPEAHTHGSGDLTGGASGTFTTADAKTVTVVNGLITAIV